MGIVIWADTSYRSLRWCRSRDAPAEPAKQAEIDERTGHNDWCDEEDQPTTLLECPDAANRERRGDGGRLDVEKEPDDWPLLRNCMYLGAGFFVLSLIFRYATVNPLRSLIERWTVL